MMGNKEFLALTILGLLCIGSIVGLIYIDLLIPAMIGVIVAVLLIWAIITLTNYFYEKTNTK